ncbi:MAG: alanine racemase [Gammaproteobacteria bacterium]|nr:alanine racemase [Gammaproteobacteria bacterium]
MRATRVELKLSALRHNLQMARRAAPHSRIMAAIKADGYGHGMVRVARALGAATDALAVASIGEAVALREAGIETPIALLEGFFHADELALIQQHRVTTVVHHHEQLAMLEQAPLNTPVQVWLKVDSGMHRLGFLPEHVQEAWARLGRIAGVKRLGFLTHLANADDRSDPATTRQLQAFAEATVGLEGLRSVANSAGVLGWPASHTEWARPGIMLYGVSPFVGRVGMQEGLEPVMTLRSELIAVNHLKRGFPVGYGGTWTCPEDMPVGVVAAGYGDGYPRHARTGTPVLVNGKRVPLIGRVSMDMLTVDLRSQPDARVGDPVVLWGDELPVEEVAECAGTIAYTLLCGITPRVARVEI